MTSGDPVHLYEADRHEALKADAWHPLTVAAEIDAIASDATTARQADGGWPLHPLDAESYRVAGTKWSLYSGAAGVVIGLEILRARGHRSVDLRADLPDMHRRYGRSPDTGTPEPGLQLGEIGILAPRVLAVPEDATAAARLEVCMETLLPHDALEITSGQTGMMHAALALFEATGERRWLNWYRRGAEVLWDAWRARDDGPAWVWSSRLFGQTRSYFGACHGLAGNVGALLAGRAFLPPERLPALVDRTAATLAEHARLDGGLANWTASAPPIPGRLLVQWCHGAPGIVMALRAMPRARTASARRIDRLLLQAAELTWRAGPVTKGSGLCHGTSGNGLGLLAMHARTGEDRWLARARSFAMHAVRQARSARERHGGRRFSLMTGDVGLAVFLSYCLDPGDIRFPGLERFS